MSAIFSRNKGKRGRTTSSSEANNSFVKSVTSRVSGLIPATITKWFSSPSSSSANGTLLPNEATDSSTDDEAAEVPVMTEPPLKKMRFSSDAIKIENQSFELPLKTTESCNTFSVIQSPPVKSTFRRETNFVSTPIRPADETTTEDWSDKEKHFYTSQLTVSQIGRSIEKKRKSLFNNDTKSNDDAAVKASLKESLSSLKNPKQPSFKASLLGSPFYSGRTTYGGRSSSLYMDQPNIKQTKVAVVQDSNTASDNSMSQAARRVLDLLEHYASPLIEAKRIPQYTRPKQNQTLASLTADSSMSERINKIKPYKTQELHVPSMASYLRVKQRSKLMDSTTAARQIIASQSSSSEMNVYPIRPPKDTKRDQNKFTTKVTSRLTRQRRGEASEADTEVVAPIKLPTGVLQINKDNLPKFSFAATIVPNSASNTPKLGMSTESRTPISLPIPTNLNNPKLNLENTSKEDTHKADNDNIAFKFSRPIRISKEQHQVASVRSNFIFGSPDRNVDKEKDISVSSVVGESTEIIKLPATKTDDWKCSDCWVHNKPNVDKCLCCGGKKPSTEGIPPKCSVCKTANSEPNATKCNNCARTATATAEKLPIANNVPILNASDKWKCTDCWVNNDVSHDKCQCCGGKKPKAASEPAITQIKEASWRCDECWVMNKSGASSCAACGSAPPAPAGDLASATKPAAASCITDIIKSQSVKWECTSCLVKNESDQVKCVCCETSKPGAAKEPQKKFNFGVANTSFKFGIDPNTQNSTKVGDDKNAIVTFKKAEAEKNNNNLSSTPSFTFGIPTQKLGSDANNKLNVDLQFAQPSKLAEVQTAPEKPSFGSFKLITDTKAVVNTTPVSTEPEQEVPRFKEESKPVQAATPVAFEYFGAASSAQLKTGTLDQISDSPTLSAFAPPKAKDANNTALDRPPVFDEPKNNLTFSPTSGSKHVFASPSPVQPMQSPTMSLTPVKPATVSSISTTTLFPKNESLNLTPQIGISKSDTSASTAVFGFGSNTNTQPETKPKFNFTFGSTKSEAPPAFSASFGGGGFTMPTPALAPSAPLNGGVTDNQQNNMFGAVQKENVWPTPALNNGSSNMFVSSTPTNTQQKPSFSFGSSTASFASGNMNQTPAFASGPTNNALPAFGSSAVTSPTFGINQQAASPIQPAFGSNVQGSNSIPTFGSNQQNSIGMATFGSNQINSLTPAFGQQATGVQPTFGSSQQNSMLPSPFGSNQQNTITTPAFGASQQNSSPFGSSVAPAFGAGLPIGVNSTPNPVFGSNQATSNAFGMSNPSVNNQPAMFANPMQNQGAAMFGSGGQPAPTGMFGAPAASPPQQPAAAPSFSFGTGSNNAMFGFGQQPQQQQQQQQQGVYNFGGAPGPSPIVQFNMGSSTGPAAGAQNIASRRFRKPVRRRRNDELR